MNVNSYPVMANLNEFWYIINGEKTPKKCFARDDQHAIKIITEATKHKKQRLQSIYKITDKKAIKLF